MARTILEVGTVGSGSDGSDVVVLEVIEPSSPFVGLFAWRTDLRKASESLAHLVWADQVVALGRRRRGAGGGRRCTYPGLHRAHLPSSWSRRGRRRG